MGRAWVLALALLAAAGCTKPGGGEAATEEPDFNAPVDRGHAESRVQNRRDLESLPATTVFISTGDHGSTELGSHDLQVLARFPRLQRLHLRHCRGIGDDGLNYIADRTSLCELDLSGCVALTGEGIQRLSRLTNLREVLLNYCPKIRKADIQRLSQALPRADIVWSSDDPPMGGPPNHPEHR